MPNGEQPRAFEEWLVETYGEHAVERFAAEGRIPEVYRYFVDYVDVPAPLPLGRPQQEKYGLTDTDWQVLMKLSGDPTKVEKELRTWLSTGYITEFQARDIWDEADYRVRQATGILLTTGLTQTEWDALSRTEQQAYMQRGRVRQPTYRQPTYRTTRAKPQPFTDYGAGLEEMRLGFQEEMPPTERWRDWFRSKYPRLIEQFEGQLRPKERMKEKTWTEWLQKREPEIREQWWKLSPYERGERPSVYAPRIQTVKFT